MGCVDPLSASDLAGYLDGDLSPESRTRIEAHLDQCPDCWSDLQAVARLQQETAQVPRRRIASRWKVYAGLAIAAGLAGIVVARSRPTGPAAPTVEPTERPAVGPAEAIPSVTILAPRDGASVAPTQLVFTWRSGPADSYRITVLDETGAPVWTDEVSDTSIALASGVALKPGRLYFWRVDAVSDGLSATTGIHRFQVTP